MMKMLWDIPSKAPADPRRGDSRIARRKKDEDASSVPKRLGFMSLPFEGREGWGVCEYEDAPPLRISHTHSPPPPMAEPFSLRLGHARVLTTVQVVSHYPRAASLPGGSLIYSFPHG